MKTIAIIGTAGRDKSKPMTLDLWEKMWEDASSRFVTDDIHLISGGAAWADHLAVALFLNSEVAALTLHLPAPLSENGIFVGPEGSAASAANFYHEKFSATIGKSSRNHIRLAKDMGATVTEQPAAKGYGAMFMRNNLVAQDAKYGCLAYTWGSGSAPEDGGTQYTWSRCSGRKVHVPLQRLLEK